MSQASPVSLEEILAEFKELGDWDAQCDYLIDLGYELPKLPADAKTEANRVRGCQSNVWMIAQVADGDPPVIEFLANSDAIIVNGLIAVLMAIFNRHTPREILTTDAHSVFAQLGLERHLSSQRRNGLYGMVERVRQVALAAAGGGGDVVSADRAGAHDASGDVPAGNGVAGAGSTGPGGKHELRGRPRSQVTE